MTEMPDWAKRKRGPPEQPPLLFETEPETLHKLLKADPDAAKKEAEQLGCKVEEERNVDDSADHSGQGIRAGRRREPVLWDRG
jgi:hypothetical protein